MKLGIICGWQEEHFAEVKAKGLEAVEFCINDKVNSDEVLAIKEQIRANSEKYGVAVGSIGRWGMTRIDENGKPVEAALHHDKNLIDLASYTGCPVYNVGCNYIESLSYYENCQAAIAYFSVLLDYAGDKNVKIATYNCDWSNFVYEEKAWSVIHGALPELGIKYDVSHCVHRNGNYLKELHDWGTRIYHFHLKGTLMINGESVDDPPVGLDDTNWGAVMCLLYTSGYDGMLSIEPHSHRWRDGRGQWGIDFTINFMRKYIMPDSYKNMTVSQYMP